ncbi:MAG: LamG domain-containing protein, partial [Candidatus Saccharimonadales bacterium]
IPTPGVDTATSMRLSVQPRGLAAYYPMDEGSGSVVADASSHQNDGSFVSPATWTTPGKIGNAAVDIGGVGGSGSNAAVLIPDTDDLPRGTAMTAEAWVRQLDWTGGAVAFMSHWNYNAPRSGAWAFQTGGNYNLRVFIATSLTEAGDNYVDTAVNSWSQFPVWRHVAMTFDGVQSAANRVKIYIDGVQQSTTMYGTIPSTILNSDGAFSIGSFPGLGRGFNGVIDQVKLFNRTLSATEIAAEYSAQAAGAPTGLTLGTLTVGSNTALMDTIVRTDAGQYGLSIHQDHNLQKGSDTIGAMSASIASPGLWAEGTTKGLGFTLTAAPNLDSKWGTGSKYAAFPNTPTTFYTATGHVSSAIDVISSRLRLNVFGGEPQGAYTNTITISGTSLP